MRILIGLVCLATGLAASAASTQTATPDPLRASVENTVTRFEQAYRDCGLTPAFSAEVEIRSHPGLISYSNAERTVLISRFDDLPAQLRGQMEAWAKPAGASDGPALFETIFQRLGTAHEMGHWQQHVSRRFLVLDRWDREIEANRIAIAFWSLDPEDSAALSASVNGWLSVMGQLPNPAPEGTDPRAYLEQNYAAVASNAAQYGWYQGEFLRQAWARRGEAGFCELARLNAPAPIEAFADDQTKP